ncbi:MAG TPA: hypothetical protein VI895_01930 [Bdellovibrionota bacterium]|nr:hypothetical protein [Bdellovibrionota bacterium]
MKVTRRRIRPHKGSVRVVEQAKRRALMKDPGPEFDGEMLTTHERSGMNPS